MAFDIELDQEQVEKGLDRAARKISQRANIPGFRKGKAPRFIVENYFGREALMEEAADDLINKAFREALEKAAIAPVGQASLQSVEQEPFRFRVTVPVPPTVTLPAHRDIRVPLSIEPIGDDEVEAALNRLRDKHAVLQELEEPRPAEAGDQLTVRMESLVDGEPLEPREDDQEIAESTLVLEAGRLVDGLYEGLLGVNVGETREITVHMPDDHANEEIRDKDVTFRVAVTGIQGRLLPEWDELPTLESFDGSLDELRAQTREQLEKVSQDLAERKLLDSYIEQLVEQTEYDIPDVLIREQADDLLEEQLSGLSRYGVTIDQYLQYKGQSRDEAVDELLDEGERRLKMTLALQELVRREGLNVSRDELTGEIDRISQEYDDEDQRARVLEMLQGQMLPSIANSVIDKKLRERVVAIAQGQAPALPEADAEPTAEAEPVVNAEPTNDAEQDAATPTTSQQPA
jgi:trigger factor